MNDQNKPVAGYRPGVVVTYTPDPSRFQPRWCREGMAVGTPSHGLLADTYWTGGSDHHLVTVAESASVVVLGHLDDYRQLERGEAPTDYAPADRLTITHQHRLQADHYVRVDAVPSYRARLAEQVRKVREARSEAERAVWRASWAEESLQRLLAERTEVTR